MVMIIQELANKGLIDVPQFLLEDTHYLCRMGSEAYGAALVSGGSDIDIVGFAIPRKGDIFPHTEGHIAGFSAPPNTFQQWSRHHVQTGDTKEYDLTIYGIVKFFNLVMANNPNMLDALFVPDRCVIYSSHIGDLVRQHRKMFLHKGSMHKLRGFAFSQMKKIKQNTERGSNEKRQKTIDDHGFDTKHAYHVVRLCLQAEQILEQHDLDLERNSQVLQSVRRGDWTLPQLEEWFAAKEIALEALYGTSTLQHSPDEDEIKSLLLRCLEARYGSLDAVVPKPDDHARLMRDLRAVLERHS